VAVQWLNSAAADASINVYAWLTVIAPKSPPSPSPKPFTGKLKKTIQTGLTTQCDRQKEEARTHSAAAEKTASNLKIDKSKNKI